MNQEELFQCKCCGHCCHGSATVSVSPKEEQNIAKFLDIDLETLRNNFLLKKGKRTEMRIVDGHCIFYGDDGLCKIHPVKPFHCKQWPLHPSILGDINAYVAIKSDCPGFSKKATYEEICQFIAKNLSKNS